jgi:hypothetical protein
MNVMVEWLKLLLRVWKVPGSNIGPETSEGCRATDFIAFKNPSLSAGYEPRNHASNGKLDNHYTTENDISNIRSDSCHFASHLLIMDYTLLYSAHNVIILIYMRKYVQSNGMIKFNMQN